MVFQRHTEHYRHCRIYIDLQLTPPGTGEHMPFDPRKDSTPKVSVVEKLKVRIMVADTDKGRELKEQIADLKELVAAYREGVIKERAE